MADAKTGSEKRGRRHLLAWSVVGLLAGLALAGAAWRYLAGTVWTDGRDLRVPASRSDPREVLWTPPAAFDASFNTADQEYEPSVSPDGTELYFVRGKAAHNADVYVSFRRNNRWTPPEPLAALNSAYDDLGPRLTADGKFLLFSSDRPGGVGQYDLWASPRLPDGGWGEPFNLGPSVNSEFNEFNPAPTPDGKRLVFATNRKAASQEQKEAWRATIRQNPTGDYDLFTAECLNAPPAAPVGARLVSPGARTEGDTSVAPTGGSDAAAVLTFKPAAEIPGVNTEYHEGASGVSPAGDFMYFASNRPGGFGRFDLYRSRILADAADGSARFGPPENVGPGINTPDNEADPQLALGGFHLLFSSDRPRLDTSGAGGAGGGYDLFAADSREVFPEHLARPLPTLGWSWWVLIASLLLLVPLVRMLRGWGDHRLNVLQKCLLVSVLLHVLLTIGLSFVAVTHEVIAFAKQEMGIGEVAVGADGARDVEIGLAIRSGSGGPGLPFAAEAPPAIEQRAAVASSDATTERPPTLDAGAPQAASASQTSMTLPQAAPRYVPANTSDRVTLVPPAEQTAAPQVTVALQPPVSEAERAVRPAAADVSAEKVAAPGPARVAPQQTQLAAGPADARSAGASSIADAPAVTVRPGTSAPKRFQPGDAVVHADASPNIDGPRAPGGRIRAADPEIPLAAAAGPGGPGTAGGVSRTETAAGPGGPATVDIGAGAANPVEHSMLSESLVPGGVAGVGGRRRGGAPAVGGGAPPKVIQPDVGTATDSVAAGVPVPRSAKPLAEAAPSPSLAAAEEPAPASRAAAAGQAAASPGGGKDFQPLLATTTAPARPGAGSTLGAPPLPTTRPTTGSSSGGAGKQGAGTSVARAPAPSAAPLSIGQLPAGAPVRAAAAAPEAALSSTGAAEAGVAQQKQATPAPAASAPGALAGTTGRQAGAGPVAPVRASGTESLASATPVGPRVPAPGGNGSSSLPPAGSTAPTEVNGPAVSLNLPRGATTRSAPSGHAVEGPPPLPEAVIASERVRPSESRPPGSPAGVPDAGLAAAPVAPSTSYATGPGAGAGGGSAPRPRAGDVAPVPLNLEVAITAPDVGAPAPLAQRAPEARKPLLEKWGGSQESEDAVERALDYLARQQEPDGRWTFVQKRGRPGQRPESSHDMALTALATLAFLAADHTPANDGPYKDNVGSAVDYLLSNQRPNGDLRGSRAGGGADAGNMYDQGIATLALAEAALMTGDARTTAAALKAAQFIVKAQDRESGGWRYLPGEFGDTSVFGWQIMALHSARQLGFAIPEKTLKNALRYVALTAQGESGALAGYQPGTPPTQAMTAELLFARILLGEELGVDARREASTFLAQNMPDAQRPNFYGWYYGSLSMLQLQDAGWKKWNQRTRETLVRMQKRGGDDDGCWDGNVGRHDRGGRIYTTALGALTLEVYYRYLPVTAEDADPTSRPGPKTRRPNIGYLAR